MPHFPALMDIIQCKTEENGWIFQLNQLTGHYEGNIRGNTDFQPYFICFIPTATRQGYKLIYFFFI